MPALERNLGASSVAGNDVPLIVVDGFYVPFLCTICLLVEQESFLLCYRQPYGLCVFSPYIPEFSDALPCVFFTVPVDHVFLTHFVEL